MKNLVIISAIASLLFSACKTTQLSTYSDDVYSNPADDKRLAKLEAEQRAKKDLETKQKQEDERLAKKAKDDSNPLYQDPNYNQDDYYDYQYASRVRRFNQPINGAGYYDNYYTNQYYYNQNASCYGSSIYSTYGYMPSNQFYNYSNGLSMSFGYGNGYNHFNNTPYSYCGNTYGNYNSYGNNNYYGNNAYNPYGYNNFYGNNYGTINNYYGNNYNNNNGGWGYLNGQDPNSNYAAMYNGPRGSNGGNNGGRSSSAGMAVPEDLQYKAKNDFFQSVVQKQEVTPRFTEIIKPNRTPTNEENVNAFLNNTNGQSNINPTRNTTKQNENLNTNSPQQNNSNTTSEPKKGGFLSGFFNGNNTASTTETPNANPSSGNTNSTPRRNNSGKISGIENNSNTPNSSEKSSSPNWNSSPNTSGSSEINNGGSSSPRGGGSTGGGGRPK